MGSTSTSYYPQTKVSYLEDGSLFPILNNNIGDFVVYTDTGLPGGEVSSIWMYHGGGWVEFKTGDQDLTGYATEVYVNNRTPEIPQYSVPYRDNTGIGIPNTYITTTSASTPYTLIERDINGRAKIISPVDPQDIANKQYIDNAIAVIPLSGIQTIVPGTPNVTIDDTDPINPIISVVSGGIVNAYTKEETDDLLSHKANVVHTHTVSQITDFPTSMPPTVHNHDDRYYTETEIDNNVVKLIGNQTIDGIKVLSQGLTTMSTPGGINMKIASRYVNSGFAHGSQGHIMQVLWGDSVSSPEGTGNDGGWGLEFGSHGNYYMKMMGTGMEIGRTDGGVELRGAVSVTNIPTSGSHVANKTYVDLIDSGRYSLSTSGTGKTIDWNNGRRQYMTMTGNCTITFSNPVAGRTYVLELTQDATGSRIITRPSTVKTPGGAGAVLSTTANAKDVVTLYYDGTNYLTHIAKAYA